jgi:hypothetical protein
VTARFRYIESDPIEFDPIEFDPVDVEVSLWFWVYLERHYNRAHLYKTVFIVFYDVIINYHIDQT